MSNVLITYNSNIFCEGSYQIPVFYEAYIRALVDEGNSVTVCNTNQFLRTPWNGLNKIKLSVNKRKVKERIIESNPDVVFAFNNSCLSGIEDYLECPIAVMEADTFLYYNDKENLKKKKDRFHFFSSSNSILQAMKNEFGISKNAYNLKFATGIKSEKVEQDKNVSFIGSVFTPLFNLKDICKFPLSQEEICDIVGILIDNPFIDYDDLLKRYNLMSNRAIYSKDDFLAMISNNNRLNVLNFVSDMGLKIYGSDKWRYLWPIMFSLSNCFSTETVYSLKHNEYIYNSSKVCMNIPHAQAKDAYPWRVMDIMASHGCLLTNKNIGLKELLKGYIEVPMYETPYEARDLCRKLLNDEKWRLDVVAGSQKCIEDQGRWIHRFKEFEEIFAIDLLNKIIKNENMNGCIQLNGDDFRMWCSNIIELIFDIYSFCKKAKRKIKKAIDEVLESLK
jgi:spore maturation protein CgeB